MKPGELIICVFQLADSGISLGATPVLVPKKGLIYTARTVEKDERGDVFIRLEEIVNEPRLCPNTGSYYEPRFHGLAFRVAEGDISDLLPFCQKGVFVAR